MRLSCSLLSTVASYRWRCTTTVRYEGRDQIEFGHKNYAEASYGTVPGGAETLYKIGYVQEIAPVFDPELNRIFVLRDSTDAGKPITLLQKKENVKLRLRWLQGQLGDYFQKFILAGYNFYGEAKLYKDASSKVYFYWAGLKTDVLSVSCSIGEPIQWVCEMIGKSFDTKATTLHSYGASPGAVWEWDDSYLQLSTNGSDWSIIPDVTDWEFRVDFQLKPNFVFNSGSKQLTTLEEMEQLVEARFTMYFPADTYLSYLLDDTELYLKLNLPNSKYLQISKGKMKLADPILKPEDLIACRVEFMGGYLEHNFT